MVTGLTNFGPELSGKWLELLKELSPKAFNIGLLYDVAVGDVVKGMQTGAAAVNVQLLPFEINSDNSLAEVLSRLPSRHPDALIVFLPPRNPELEKRIIEFRLLGLSRRGAASDDAGGRGSYVRRSLTPSTW